MGTWIVGSIVLSIVVIAASILYKDHQNGKGCGGCAGCSGCGEGGERYILKQDGP